MLYTNYYTEILLNLKDISIHIPKNPSPNSIIIQLNRKSHRCPSCNCSTSSIHDYRVQPIKDIPNPATNITIFLRKRRYVCIACSKRCREDNPFIYRYQRMTNRLKAYIISNFAKLKPASDIASDSNCSVTTAIRLFDNVSYCKPSLPEVIAIDEFKGNAGGHKFQCLIANPKHRKVLDILPTRTADDLYQYFTSYSLEERLKVKYIVMDLSTLFRSVMKNCFPNAKIVADKFHVCRLANWALESVRKEVQKQFSDYRRKYFKKSRWILLKRREKLTEAESVQLANMLTVSDKLRKAYLLKESFYELFESSNNTEYVSRLKVLQELVHKERLPKFTTFLNTITKWHDEILRAIATGYTNGYVEGLNNRTKVLKRISYGVRNFERFRNRILYISNS